MDLASSMHMQSVDVGRQHSGAHAQDLSRYLQQRQALGQFETQYGAQVVFPQSAEGAAPWQVFSRDARNAMRARTDLMNLVAGNPPSRFRGVDVHPFYQRELENKYAQQLRDQHGVHVITPDDNDNSRVLLVFEDSNPAEDYSLPKKQPAATEVRQFQDALAAAEAALLELIGQQEEIVSRSVEAPQK